MGTAHFTIMFKTIWQQYLTRADKIMLVVFALLALTSYGLLGFFQTPGDRVTVVVGDQNIASFSLQKEGNYSVNGLLGEVVLQIKDGAVRILKVSCPRKICQQMGWIKNSGEVIVCLPNRLIVRVGEQTGGNWDAIAH